MKKLGILIQNFSNVQFHQEIVSTLNEAVEYVPYLFYDNWGSVLYNTSFTKLTSNYALNFSDMLVSTDLITTTLLQKCQLSTRKVFYIQDLEWRKVKSMFWFKDFAEIYLDKELELIVKTEKDYNIISKVWRKPDGILPSFTQIEELWQHKKKRSSQKNSLTESTAPKATTDLSKI